MIALIDAVNLRRSPSSIEDGERDGSSHRLCSSHEMIYGPIYV